MEKMTDRQKEVAVPIVVVVHVGFSPVIHAEDSLPRGVEVCPRMPTSRTSTEPILRSNGIHIEQIRGRIR